MTLWDKDKGYRRLLLRQEDREPRGRLPEVWTQRPGSSAMKEKERGSLKTGQEGELSRRDTVTGRHSNPVVLSGQPGKETNAVPTPAYGFARQAAGEGSADSHAVNDPDEDIAVLELQHSLHRVTQAQTVHLRGKGKHSVKLSLVQEALGFTPFPRWQFYLFWVPMCVLSCLSHVRLSVTPWTIPHTRLLCLWNSTGKNTGVGCYSLLQGIFPTQGSNPHVSCLTALAGRFFTASATWEAPSECL